jgi:hypothetical protein
MKKLNALATTVLSMAYSRETFKDRIEEKLAGAMVEYYKVRIAKEIGKTKWVEHWQREVNRLLYRELYLVVDHAIRGFKDKRKAFSEVIQYVAQYRDKNFRTMAMNEIQRDFKLARTPRVDLDAMAKDFFKMLSEQTRTWFRQ